MATGKTTSVTGYYDSARGKVQTSMARHRLPADKMVIGANLGWHESYLNTKPWLNMIHSNQSTQATGAWQPAPFSYFLADYVRYFPPANYVLEWDGTGECSFSANGGASASQTANFYPTSNRKEYTVNAGDGVTPSYYWVSAVSGTPTNIRFYDAAYEVEYNAGMVLHPEFAQDLSIYDAIRPMDWQDTSGHRWDSYADYPQPGWSSYGEGVPMAVLAKAMNETQPQYAVLCAPHKYNFTDLVQMFTDFENALTYAPTITVSYSNEVWNPGQPWIEENRWAGLFDQPAIVAPKTDSTTFNSPSHGLSSGDWIVCFSSTAHNEDAYWPWTAAGLVQVIVVDSNNFQTAHNTYPSASTPPAGLTSIHYKYSPTGDQVTGWPSATNTGWAEAHLVAWAAGDAVFGRDRCLHVVGGWWNVPELSTQWLAEYPELMAGADLFEIAPYFSVAPANFPNSTDAEILAAFEAGWEEYRAKHELHFSFFGSVRWMCYEAGNHWSDPPGNPGSTPTGWARLRDFLDSPEAKTLHDNYFSYLADQGCAIYCHYNSHWRNKDPLTTGEAALWGAQSQRGRRDEGPYLALQAASLTGGALKSL
jgi:hypothetical protein